VSVESVKVLSRRKGEGKGEVCGRERGKKSEKATRDHSSMAALKRWDLELGRRVARGANFTNATSKNSPLKLAQKPQMLGCELPAERSLEGKGEED
jgi:hypothetical protein